MNTKIPDIKIVVKNNSINLVEVFDSWQDVKIWAMDNEIGKLINTWFIDANKNDKATLNDDKAFEYYILDYLEEALEECGYTIESKKAQDIAHDNGEPCDEDDCHDCCGEFSGHEFDDSEGGYCINCGAHITD